MRRGLLLLMLVFLSLPRQATAAVIRGASSTFRPLPGTGYSTQSEAFKQPCITGTVQESGAQAGTLSLVTAMSQSELESSLGFEAGGKAHFGLVSVSASAQFARSTRSTKRSLSAVYSASYEFKNLVLSNVAMTATGKQALQAQQWAEMCGNEYVAQVVRGASLYFSLRLDFASESDQESFASAFDLDAPFIGVSTRIKKASSTANQNTKVTISAFQLGGDVSKLSSIFNARGSNVYAVAECTFGRFDVCERVLSSAIAYATDLREGFPASLRPNGPADSGPADLAYVTHPYPFTNLTPPPQVTVEIANARKTLAEQFDASLVNHTRARPPARPGPDGCPENSAAADSRSREQESWRPRRCGDCLL
jgi:hypothetical protein